MKFLKFDLGSRRSGEVAVVTLTSAANVMLMDSSGELLPISWTDFRRI